MKKRKLFITLGLPGSGKTTWAKEYQKDHPDTVVVCRDDLRWMLVDYRFSRANESLVAAARDVLIKTALADRDVIVADTNLSPKVQARLEDVAKSVAGVDVEIIYKSFLDVPLHECIKRDLKREHSVGKDAIFRMWRQFLAKPEKYSPNESLPKAIIVDIDGTLAIKGHRSPYDYTKVHLDKVNRPVLDAVRRYQDDHWVIIMSGRDSACREETEQWLSDNGIEYDKLYMRAAGDNRRDSIVKTELFRIYIEDQFNVSVVFDDRDQVVNETWRTLGLTCFQVAEGNF